MLYLIRKDSLLSFVPFISAFIQRGVAIQRWQAFTGDTAKLEGDGRAYSAVVAERQPAKEPA